MFSPVRLAPVLMAGVFQCKDKEPDLVWEQFNGSDDVVEVQVTAEETPGVATSIDLTSSTGEVVIGSAVVDPGSGPVGTEHRLSVFVLDEFQDEIAKVEVQADSGERGVHTLTLVQDSADAGVWVLDVTSYGEVGEVRTDLFTFELFMLTEEDPVVKEN